ncbi:hypothetical protein EMIT0P176_140120 [Pseudomonas sp. IT-P176]
MLIRVNIPNTPAINTTSILLRRIAQIVVNFVMRVISDC